MTVKEEIQLRLSGVTSAEIKDLKEREKLEKEETPAGEPEKKEEPPKETAGEPEKKEEPVRENPAGDSENVSRETSEKDEKIKELEAQLSRLQEDNAHRDHSGNEDTRSDFEKCVDIFKNAF